MKKIKCLLNRCAFFATVLLLCLGFSSDAQYAGVVDTTFRPNANGVPFNPILNPGYLKVNGVEIIDDSIYYAFSTSIGGVSKIKKYDLRGNEDINYLNNQLSTWQNGFSTICIEPELDFSGTPTKSIFIGGRNSFGTSGIRLINKVKPNGSVDTQFLIPNSSSTALCTSIYYDYEYGKLYYMYQTGYYSGAYTQTLIQCDPNTGQTLQTISISGFSGFSNVITKIPNTNQLVIVGDLHFTLNGDVYDDIIKVDVDSFTIQPIEGVTNLNSNGYIKDIIIINPVDCQGNQPDSLLIAYIGGAFNTVAGQSGFKCIARYFIDNGVWTLDTDYKPFCYGVVTDLCYYNCQLIASGSFASSSSSGSSITRFTPKMVAFEDGQINPDFILSNTGGGLGGSTAWDNTIINNLGQGWIRCMAIQPSNDGNDRWEIVVGGDFQNYLSSTNQTIQSTPLMARYIGLNTYMNAKWNYCLDEVNDTIYQINTTNVSPNKCQKWDLSQSSDLQSWNTVRVDDSQIFYDSTLFVNMWYKLTRTVYNCGNTTSLSYIFNKQSQVSSIINNGVQLRTLSIANNEPVIIDNIEENLIIYPNPFSSSITIKDNYANIKNVSVYNALGGKVFNMNYNSNLVKIDLDYLSKGVYIVVLTTDKGIEKRKIIK
jgi:hypothetical protein